MTKEKHIVDSMMVDANLNLRLNSALTVYQDVAVHNVDELGLGMDKLLNEYGYMWVVTRMYLEFYKCPKYLEEINVSTYPSSLRGGFAFMRQAEIADLNDNPYIKISSTWILMDHATHRMVIKPKVPDFQESHPNPLPEPGKINKEEADLVYTRTVRYCDCDLNNHLNNVRYVDIILDLFDADFFKEKMIATMLINYEKEVRCGETIEVFANADRTYVEGIVNGNSVFKCKLTFKAKQ